MSENGATSFVAIVAPPMNACVPTRQNWWTPEKPPRVAKSWTSTWPERAAAFAKIVWLPTRQSWATCTWAMSRLSEPIRVTPPPPAVPRWTVVPSRNTLRSPISTRVASPRNLRSCGTRPIELKGKKRFPSPTRVSPSITTCDSTTVRRPRRTLSPITQKGPTRTPGSRTAPAATRASGSTSGGGSVATCRRRRASAARDSPTRTSPWKRTSSPRRWTSCTSRRSWSPGTTGRRNFVSSKPTTRISTFRGSGAVFSSQIPAACASASRISTPGMTGWDGK